MNDILNPGSRCNLRVQLGFVLLIAAMAVPTVARAITTGPTISNNTFSSTPVGGSLTQTVTLTLTSVVTIKSIAIQPGVPGAAEYAIQSVTGCTVDNVTQSSVGTVCDVSIKFMPQLPGNTTSPTFARNATLLFTDSGGDVFAYGLTGAATGPVAKVVPGKVSLYAGVQETGLNALDLGLGLVTGGYGGDGGPATSATFNLTGATASNSLLTQPLAFDNAGNLYVADAGNYIIRKIDNTSAHNVTTIAGTPTVTGTSAGSGGLATNATLAYPHAITVDAAGNIFFIDAASQYSYYSIVYRIDAVTKIITAIGGQFYNPSDGYNSAQGGGTCNPDLGQPGYFECGDGGLATYASLPSARNLAIDAAGNLYLWEDGGYIRKIVPSTGIITTFATAADFPADVAGGTSSALGGMTLASDGNFYVLVDAGDYELIYELNTTTQAVTVVAGGQQPNYTGSCDSSGSSTNTSAPFIDVAEGQAGYPGAQLFVFTNGVVASTGDLTSDASGNIYYSGAQCNSADVYNYRPAVFRINIPTNTVYLETVGGSSGTATRNYDAYAGFSIAPASAIPDGNGDLYFTTNNQIAVVSASAGALDFGLQNEFTTGITRIATYENVGNATDTGPTYSLETGLDFTDVSATDTNACSLLTQVGVNKTCNIDYAFTPIQPNEITDTIDLAEATPGSNPGFGLTTSAQTVTLTGDATPEAQFVVTPASLDFGNVVVGQSATKTFTVSNAEGGAALGLYGIFVYPNGAVSPPTEYTLAGTCDPSDSSFSVPAGSSCTITVTFTPTAIGSYPTTLTINNSVTNPEEATFAITGAGTSAATPTATLAPSPLAFGNQTVNTSSAGTNLTLSNTSGSTLNISGITIGGTNPSDFSDTTTCGATLAANTSCTITVVFKPTSAATFNAMVSVADSATDSPQTATLSGTGTAAATPTATLTPSTLSFGNETVNSTATAPSLTLSNTGDATLNISSITIGGANPSDFAQTSTCGATLAANASCSITVTFTPLSSAPFNATVSVADNASGSPQTTTLSGTGTTAAVATATLAPNPLVFSSVSVSNYSIGTATLTNTGTAALSNIVPSLTGAGASAYSFYPTGSCGNTLAVGDSCTYVLHFSPGAAGGYAATLSVADSGSGSPQTIPLSGIATPAAEPEVQFTPTILSAIAGTGTMPTDCVDPAEPGPALQTQLCGPSSVAVDLAGNVYIAEPSENVVKKLDTSGNVTTFAGVESSGAGSYSGDNGPANAAHLNQPLGLAIDGLGNVYISDSGNERIREVNATTGTITTFVGGGSGTDFNGGTGTTVVLSPAGIAFDPSGNLYIAEPTQQIVVKVTSLGAATLFAGVQTPGGPGTAGYNGDNVQATAAELNAPTSVASDRNGNIYISDSLNYRIRYVNENFEPGLIATVAGNGTKGDTGDGGVSTSAEINPLSIAMNEADDIFISDGTTLRKVDGNGNISTFAGGGTGSLGGPATAALLSGVGQPGIDNNGNVLIPVSGTPEVLSAGPTGLLQFGNQAVGTTSAPLTITVENTGNNYLNFNDLTFTATGAFSVTGGTCEEETDGGYSPGGTCTLTVTFTPTATGAQTGSVSVPTNANASPSTITLQGTGTMAATPAATLSPTTLSFGDTVMGVTATAQTLTLSNSGNAVLNISGISITGANPNDFAEASTCGETLAADASCTISVTFTPSSIASFAAAISVADNATGSPQTAALSGAGIAAPDFTVSATPPTQTASYGGSATYNVSVGTVNGDFSNPVTLSATGLPTGATATFTPASVTPGSDGASSVLTIQTAKLVAQTHTAHGRPGWSWIPSVTLAFCIPLLWWRRRDRVWWLSTGLLCVLLTLGAGMVSGCGGGYYSETPAQTYTITVTGISGSTQHSTTVTLTVQEETRDAIR
jgi:hypothetical protein